jgi:ferric-dicitrate binding protein FerR (iron transport regulator)
VSRGGSCGAVRGTKFSVEAKGDETEFAVYEGAVEVGDLEGRKTVLVEAGFKVVVAKDAISEPVKIAAVDNWWEK